MKTYILRICGSDAPTQYPDGTAIEAGAKHFSVPVKGVASGWSTPCRVFEQLDLMDEVKLVDASYTHSPCLHAAKVAGDITQDEVPIVRARLRLRPASSSSSAGPVPHTGRCNCDKDVVFDARGDDTPLGRAEWIKFLATFFNEEDRANLVFSREKAAYDATKALATAAAALHEVTKAKKKCAWIGHRLQCRTIRHSLDSKNCIQAEVLHRRRYGAGHRSGRQRSTQERTRAALI